MIHVKYDGNYYYALSSDGINFSNYCYCFDKMINKWLRVNFNGRGYPVTNQECISALEGARRKIKLEKLLQ